jgi:hypothetical protein
VCNSPARRRYRKRLVPVHAGRVSPARRAYAFAEALIWHRSGICARMGYRRRRPVSRPAAQAPQVPTPRPSWRFPRVHNLVLDLSWRLLHLVRVAHPPRILWDFQRYLAPHPAMDDVSLGNAP